MFAKSGQSQIVQIVTSIRCSFVYPELGGAASEWCQCAYSTPTESSILLALYEVVGMNMKNDMHVCAICGKSLTSRDLIPAAAVRDVISAEIVHEYPKWSSESFICRTDLARYRTNYVHALLETERGELTSLEREVLLSIRDNELLAMNVEAESEGKWSLGEKMADRIATFGGSWKFLICFGGFLALWIAINTVVLLVHPPDPYPFILLNLVLSCLASIQAPIIMMSQNRQEAKDRLRSQHDYQVNLKAELEIRHLHDKVDHLLSHQWDRLAQIQEIQIDILSEVGKRSETLK